MPLMTDPSVIYGLEVRDQWRGAIYKSDLGRDTPYNTYLHPGLPPGPIANPGIGSIKAALNPADTNYLFFVAKADGSGGHTFSSDLAGHTAAVGEYHRNLQQK